MAQVSVGDSFIWLTPDNVDLVALSAKDGIVSPALVRARRPRRCSARSKSFAPTSDRSHTCSPPSAKTRPGVVLGLAVGVERREEKR